MKDYFSLLELQLCKVHNQITTLKGNEYSNPSLDSYQEDLFSLFESVSIEIKSDTSDLTKDFDKFNFLMKCLDFIGLSVQFLEDSVLNVIPYETVYCLDKALKDWVKEKHSFVTSLNKNEYSFNDQLSIDEEKFFDLVNEKYGIKFKNRLIQVSIPKHDVNDYFFNVVLYHELGHFVDLNYKISESIVYEEFSTLSVAETDIKINHFREYFADLFAAQYISSNVSNYLNYEARFDGESETHPSTESRTDLVELFISGYQNEETEVDEEIQIIELIQKACETITGKKLEIRYEKPNLDDFYDYIPPIIESDKQLHGLFVAGWEIWTNNKDKFSENNIFKLYVYINNLIEKSISNYMVTTEWQQAKDVSQ